MVYSKNKQGELVGINVEPKQAMEELVHNIEEFGSIKRVRINIHCCQCSRNIEEILFGDIDAEINILNYPFGSGINSTTTEEVV